MVKLEKVTFWVTEGGRKWLDFKVGRAAIVKPRQADSSPVLPEQWIEVKELPVSVTIAEQPCGTLPVIDLDGDKFHPVLQALQTVTLSRIPK